MIVDLQEPSFIEIYDVNDPSFVFCPQDAVLN